MESGNPVLTREALLTDRSKAAGAEVMTLQGSVNRTAILLGCVLLTSVWTWSLVAGAKDPSALTTWMWVGIFGGMVAAIATVIKPVWAPITAPIYALFEGLFIGGMSAALEAAYPGIVMQAASLTFATLGALLLAYSTGFIQVTEKFRLGLFAATAGIGIVYLVSIVLSFFHIQVPFIYGSGIAGIAFSIFVVVIAALNLVIDFDFIEKGAMMKAPKYMEWYAAFGLMVTLIWLYVEILRLLAKTRENR